MPVHFLIKRVEIFQWKSGTLSSIFADRIAKMQIELVWLLIMEL